MENQEDPRAIIEFIGFQEGNPLFECNLRQNSNRNGKLWEGGSPVSSRDGDLEAHSHSGQPPEAYLWDRARKPPKVLNIPLSHQLGLI